MKFLNISKNSPLYEACIRIYRALRRNSPDTELHGDLVDSKMSRTGQPYMTFSYPVTTNVSIFHKPDGNANVILTVPSLGSSKDNNGERSNWEALTFRGMIKMTPSPQGVRENLFFFTDTEKEKTLARLQCLTQGLRKKFFTPEQALELLTETEQENILRYFGGHDESPIIQLLKERELQCSLPNNSV